MQWPFVRWPFVGGLLTGGLMSGWPLVLESHWTTADGLCWLQVEATFYGAIRWQGMELQFHL